MYDTNDSSMDQFNALDSYLNRLDDAMPETPAAVVEAPISKSAAASTEYTPHYKDLDSVLTTHETVSELKVKRSTKEAINFPPDDTFVSRSGLDLLMVVGSIVMALLLSSMVLQKDVPITGSRITLGLGGYQRNDISAPAISGIALNLISKIISTSRLGPWIRRSMLNENQLEMLRELSAQCTLPPMDYPMMRLGETAWQQVASDASWYGSSIDTVLSIGFDMELLHSKKLNYSSIMDYHNAYKSNQTSPLSVMRITVAKVAEWQQSGYPIFSSFNRDDVFRQAEASSARYARGQYLSVLDGVPVALKDLVEIEGHVSLNGKNKKVTWGDPCPFDDAVASRFRSLGAILFGAAIMTEGGMSPLGYNAHYQGPFNAYSSSHFSGGSSSGSAVAVSSGLVPLAVGFDSGGSIRLPAAWSGLHGLAPTFGRVPLDKEIYMSMIKAGPIANCAIDAALGYAVMASRPSDRDSFYGLLYDGGNRGVPPAHLKNFGETSDLSDVRIGVYPDWIDDATPAVKALIKQAVELYRKRGAIIVEIGIPHLNWLALAHGIKISTEYVVEWDHLHHTRFSDLEPQSRLFLSTGASFSALEVLSADRLRAWAFNFTAQLFDREKLTAIVTPTTGFTAPVLKRSYKSYGLSNTSLVMNTMKHVFFANFIGLPAHSVPVGFSTCPETGKELPVGMQLIGSHWGEHNILRLANVIDQSDLVHNAEKKAVSKEHFFNPLTNAIAYAKILHHENTKHQ